MAGENFNDQSMIEVSDRSRNSRLVMEVGNAHIS
jgi:hypothetical protein